MYVFIYIFMYIIYTSVRYVISRIYNIIIIDNE